MNERKKKIKELKSSRFDSPLGSMISVADEEGLYLLEFEGCKGLEREIERLKEKMVSSIAPGATEPLRLIQRELALYFEGKLQAFITPFFFLGSPFQNRVWQELQKIPFGETKSYAEIAKAIGQPTAFRAVALANGANQLAIIVPCHRVINSGGQLGGYGGGVERKQWLLDHERNIRC
jgi:AraC family transcriptional regulator of adaptative response/methylated-DNA-[protein]-cysteine methyltransferase